MPSQPIRARAPKTLLDSIYYQQEIDVIPGWLSLVGAFTWANIETIVDTNLGFNAPYASTDQAESQWLHRFGGILHLTKDLVLYACLNSTTFSPPAGGTDYYNNRLPNVRGEGNEVGLKTAFFGGRLSATISVYHASLTNQAIVAAGQNVVGIGYSIPIGSTTSKGVDGELAISVVPGLQLLATGYNGSVRDQTGNEAISNTYDNSWSLFTRYDFANEAVKREGWLNGLAVGGGVSRIGSNWLSTAQYTSPIAPGYVLPAAVKLHEGTPVNLFCRGPAEQALDCAGEHG